MTYDISLKLKQLSFNEPCFAYYREDAIKNDGSIYEYITPHEFEEVKNSQHIKPIFAPLWEQAIDWFKEQKGIEIEVFKSVVHHYINYILQPPVYEFSIDKIGHTSDYLYHSCDHDNWSKTYIEARVKAVLKVIEIIEKNSL